MSKPIFNEDDFAEIANYLEAQHKRRRSISLNMLFIRMLGNTIGRLSVSSFDSIVCEIHPYTTVLEFWSEDEEGDILLTSHNLLFDENNKNLLKRQCVRLFLPQDSRISQKMILLRSAGEKCITVRYNQYHPVNIGLYIANRFIFILACSSNAFRSLKQFLKSSLNKSEVQGTVYGYQWSLENSRMKLIEDIKLNSPEAERVYLQSPMTLESGWLELGYLSLGQRGSKLSVLGERMEEEKGVRQLGELEAAYRQALVVWTSEALPQDWAVLQNNLGNVLSARGMRAAGGEGVRLLGEAANAYREVLKIHTREQVPQDWAVTQNNLGIVLFCQGERTEGPEGKRLLCEAVAAYREALKVYTREQLPQQWAMTQNNLGKALTRQGERAEGEERWRLLGDAVAAYSESLKVYTREQLPQQWANVEKNLDFAIRLMKLIPINKKQIKG